ncbi:hypothetical protein [Methylobacterium oxalidis]|uniref:hypothetical protein n=1 Tax=Methylobacterium oxalidis TaxID=944322 RepID=UPI003314C0F5
MRVMRVLGVALVLGLLAWIVTNFVAPVGRPPAPDVIGLGSAFEGNLQLPAEKIASAFSAARERMLDINGWGARLRLAGDIASWLSFAATAAITLIVGFHGRAPAASGGPASTDGLPGRSVRLIGFLAALAAVLTAFGNLSIVKSQDYFKRADEMRDLIVRDRAQVIDAPNADAAQAILDDLALKTTR